MDRIITPLDAKRKLEAYCAYQERCHDEVVSKLYSLRQDSEAIDEIIAHLIQQNFLNEERFARSFARGKHRIKSWGRIRIVNELKARHITAPNIKAALSELDPDEYTDNFEALAERYWNTLHEKNVLRKRKKLCDFLLRKGYESDLVYEVAIRLENSQNDER